MVTEANLALWHFPGGGDFIQMLLVDYKQFSLRSFTICLVNLVLSDMIPTHPNTKIFSSDLGNSHDPAGLGFGGT